jgi:hypothetical protein
LPAIYALLASEHHDDEGVVIDESPSLEKNAASA